MRSGETENFDLNYAIVRYYVNRISCPWGHVSYSRSPHRTYKQKSNHNFRDQNQEAYPFLPKNIASIGGIVHSAKIKKWRNCTGRYGANVGIMRKLCGHFKKPRHLKGKKNRPKTHRKQINKKSDAFFSCNINIKKINENSSLFAECEWEFCTPRK